MADGRKVGEAAYLVGDNGRTATIEGISIRPDLRSHGIGTTAYRLLEKRLRARGIRMVYVDPIDERALKFWKRRGFGHGKRLGRRSKMLRD